MAAPAQWSRVKEILGEALDRSLVERAAFLDHVCSRDAFLRSEVESLLAAYNEAEGFSDAGWRTAFPEPVQADATVGPYRLERELGSGGMGQVWLAEQTQPVHRSVALKLIRAGYCDSNVLHRFLWERQSLALMSHPSIAKVFEAGTTTAGQPYFAMEYVDGLPITTYCDTKRLGIPERLRLFLQVCQGVQHAHQRAIIHRDLKPSNILVVEVDGKPEPRIIDFGLAKPVTRMVAYQVALTQAGAFVGTPGYMSPEQADPFVQDVDTRTDVYSLGVILYELLTGCLPFDPQRWKKQRLDDVLREIREVDPPRPSAKAGASATAAGTRGMEAPRLAKLLRGDLDCITLKALEPDPERRYGTPFELAADVARYLDNRLVAARPAGAWHRARKYIRRHRLALSIAAAAATLLLAFAVTQTIQVRNIKRERDRADFVTKFMTGMFKVSDPAKAQGNQITVREILDKAAIQIQAELGEDPALQAQLMQVMGRVYEDLGLYSRARPLLEKALKLRITKLGPDNPKTLDSMDDLSILLGYTGHPVEAEKLQRQSLDKRRSIQGPDHSDVRKSISNLAVLVVDQGRYAEGEKLDREALALFTRALGPEHSDTLNSMNNLAADYLREGRHQEAKSLLLRTLPLERRVLGVNHPATLASMNNLAATLLHLGQYADGQKLQEETRDIQRRVLGPNHPDTAGSTYNLACLAARQGHSDEAFAFLRQALDHGLNTDEGLGIKDDEDLKSLRSDPRFKTLVSYAQNLAASKQP